MMSEEGFDEAYGLPTFVVAAFFLLRNVARIGRPMELAWTVVATFTCVLAVPGPAVSRLGHRRRPGLVLRTLPAG